METWLFVNIANTEQNKGGNWGEGGRVAVEAEGDKSTDIINIYSNDIIRHFIVTKLVSVEWR